MPDLRASRAILLIAALSVAFGAGVSAHRQDEFLQAARIGVEPDGIYVELNLTPGIAVADSVVRDIDADGDGVLSHREQQLYAARVLGRIALRVDGSPVPLLLGESSFPSIPALRTGEAAIELRSSVALPSLASGAHRLFFGNDNGGSVYLANVLMPETSRVAVTGLQRDFDQRELIVDFALRDAPLAARAWAWVGFAGLLTLTARLIGMGYRRATVLP